MKYAVSPRVTAEICLVLLVFCLFAPVGPYFWVLAAFAVAVLLCGIAAAHFDRASIRLLCCLPAALLIPVTGRIDAIIVTAVCWLFAAIRFASGRFTVEYWVYRREFAVLSFADIAASIAIAAGVSSPGVIGFAAFSILLGIFSLRVIRAGNAENAGWHAYSALELALPLGAAAGISALVWLFLKAILYVLQCINGLIGDPEKTPPPASTYVPEDQSFHFIPSKIPYGSDQQYADELVDTIPSVKEQQEDLVHSLPPQFWVILILAVIAVAALFTVIIIRKRKAKKKAADNANDGASGINRRGRRARRKEISPKERIRTAYRSYLFFLQQQGQSIRSSDTSQDVLFADSARDVSRDEFELRDLYIAARYGDGSHIDPSDASRAEELLGIIRGEK